MMTMLKSMGLAMVAAIALIAPAQAKVVIFSDMDIYGNFTQVDGNGNAVSFVDGTFSHGQLGGVDPDGFHPFIVPTMAYNGYGVDEYISFYSGVTLNSLTLMNANCCGITAASVTVSLFDSGSNFLTSQTWTGGTEVLTFDTANTSKVLFNVTGGGDFYEHGYNSAWFEIADVTYEGGTGVTPVPEPQTYALLLSGLFLLTFTARRARRPAPARTVL